MECASANIQNDHVESCLSCSVCEYLADGVPNVPRMEAVRLPGEEMPVVQKDEVPG